MKDDELAGPSSNEYFRSAADRKERAAQRTAEHKGKLVQFKRDLLKRQIDPKKNEEISEQEDAADGDAAAKDASLKNAVKSENHQERTDTLTQKTEKTEEANQQIADRQQEVRHETHDTQAGSAD